METKITTVNRRTGVDIIHFAQEKGLEIEINERAYPIDHPRLFYAHIKNGEVKDGIILSGISGDANDPFEALGKLADALSFQDLVIDAMSKTTRREINVPRLFAFRDTFLRSIKNESDA